MLAARKSFDNAAPAADRRDLGRALPANLLHATFGHQHGGVVLNLSEGGFAVATALALLDRVVPNITITLGPGDDQIKAAALTVWTAEATQRAGFQFIGLEAAQRERLRNWVRLQTVNSSVVLEDDAVTELSAPKKVWSANPHLLPYNHHAHATAPELSAPIPSVIVSAEPAAFALVSTNPVAAQPPIDLSQRLATRSVQARFAVYVAAAFLFGSALTFVGAQRWIERSSAAERSPEALEKPDASGDGDSSSNILPAGSRQMSDQPVLILPTATNTPYRASLLKEEIPGPASMHIVSQRSLYLPGSVLRENAGQSLTAKSLVPGRLLTEIIPEFPALHGAAAPTDTLRIRAHVNQDGRVVEVSAISGPTAQIQPVLNAVAKWRYEPTLLDGKPVQTQVDLTIEPVSVVQ